MGKLNEAAELKIREICHRYTDEKTPLMIILEDIQNEYGYIPLEVQEIVSAKTGISVAEIYGVVTFYSFFSLTPKGKYVIGELPHIEDNDETDYICKEFKLQIEESP